MFMFIQQETVPIRIEVWDWDNLSNDDFMCHCSLDVLKECGIDGNEVKITKELTVAKEYQKQKKFRKYNKKPTITFYAKYNKLF